jgi:hypothetical protein
LQNLVAAHERDRGDTLFGLGKTTDALGSATAQLRIVATSEASPPWSVTTTLPIKLLP